MKNKVIITCAITGGIHTPSLSAALPYTPADIARQAIEAAEAGAAILHLHARDPQTGAPTGNPEVYRQFLPIIKQGTDAVINLTTGGSPDMSPDDRLAAALAFSPEMCSLNMGSMNFSFHDMGRKVTDWKFAWEKPYIEDSEKFIFRNTFADIRRNYELLAEHGTRFEHECYDIGHLYNLAYMADKGIAKPPFFIQSIFGILGGIGGDLDNVLFMKRTADRLFGDNYIWSVLGAGRFQMPVCTLAAQLGGNVRVGLEDSLFLGRGQMAASNAEQVQKIVRIMREMDLEPATPDEARHALALKGGDRTAI
ncbi:MAG TPA: 3-keto-5-aminohexanoate cleavage protein [Sphingomonas sp.]|nr:3-keto-5-aminohexanoate cleavage protein [Sphingomonas sp.]